MLPRDAASCASPEHAPNKSSGESLCWALRVSLGEREVGALLSISVKCSWFCARVESLKASWCSEGFGFSWLSESIWEQDSARLQLGFTSSSRRGRRMTSGIFPERPAEHKAKLSPPGIFGQGNQEEELRAKEEDQNWHTSGSPFREPQQPDPPTPKPWLFHLYSTERS